MEADASHPVQGVRKKSISYRQRVFSGQIQLCWARRRPLGIAEFIFCQGMCVPSKI